jgi:hypothetical protein
VWTALAPHAAALSWPGPAPCNGTLQACIDAAVSGDVIEITGNAALAGTANVTDKNLTFRPAAGATPALTADFSFQASTGAMSATIENLNLPGSRVSAYTNADGVSLSLFIRGNTIGEENADTIRFSGDYHENVTLVLEVVDNTITQLNDPGYGGSAVSVTELQSGSLNVLVSRNVINQQNGDGSAAISITDEGDDVDLIADVTRNTITGADYSAGIRVTIDDPSNVHRINLLNNLITGQGGTTCPCFLSAAIAVDMEQGAASLAVLNNTLANNEAGFVLDQTTPNNSVSLTGAMVNNIIANNSVSGIIIDALFTGTFLNQYDLVFNNAANSYTPGPGTLNTDPLFLGPGNYHLQPGSPAIDSGNDAAVLPQMTEDLDGNPRISGLSVDRGVYEFAAAEATVPTASTLMLGALSIALGLVAVTMLRS